MLPFIRVSYARLNHQPANHQIIVTWNWRVVAEEEIWRIYVLHSRKRTFV